MHFHISLLICGRLIESNSISANIVYSYQGFLYKYLPFLDLGHIGLALSASISSSLGFVILFIILKFKDRKLVLKGFFSSTLKAFIASLFMYYASKCIFSFNFSIYLRLILSLIISFMMYALLSYVLGSKELKASSKLFLSIKDKFIKN